MLVAISQTDYTDLKAEAEIYNPFSLAEDEIQSYFYDATNKRLLCMPGHDHFYKTLTSRNYPLVAHDEQSRLRQAKIGIAGQGTVGGNLAVALARHGFEHLWTSDHDTFDLSNLNRQPTDLFSIGKNKAESIAEQIAAINPFAEVQIKEPLSLENVEDFVASCEIVVSALDNPALIIALNRTAQAQKKPLLLGTDLGNKVLLDVFDYRQEIPLLHGRIQDGDEKLPPLQQVIKIVGIENGSLEMLQAIQRLIAGEISYFAQTNVAAQVCAALLLTGIKNLVLDKPIVPTSYVDVLEAVEPLEITNTRQQQRLQEMQKIKQALVGG